MGQRKKQFRLSFYLKNKSKLVIEVIILCFLINKVRKWRMCCDSKLSGLWQRLNYYLWKRRVSNIFGSWGTKSYFHWSFSKLKTKPVNKTSLDLLNFIVDLSWYKLLDKDLANWRLHIYKVRPFSVSNTMHYLYCDVYFQVSLKISED